MSSSNNDDSNGGDSNGDPASRPAMNGQPASASSKDAHGEAFDRLEQLLEFPADFPLKVMGRPVPEFKDTVVGIIQRHLPGFDASTVEMRPSAQGNWVSLTAHLTVQSRAQLEALYREISAHPLVRLVI